MKKHLLLFLCLVLTVASAQAQVRVVKSSTKKISIDVSGMRGTDDATAKLFLQTLEKDLRLSGWFEIVRKDGEIRLNGSAASSGENIKSGCQVYRLNDQQTLLSKNYNGATRAMAHRMADDIVEAVTGQKGFASMRIALIGNRSGKKEIYMCDGDGGGLRQVTNEKRIVLGPP
ncbi:MAG: hypothetical protein FJ220_06360, partial [Kiritimatiellaceae bacterium]|nr:hypothetical protein [Kiritimatiellaceae bacterium]